MDSSFSANVISVIVRFHDASRRLELARCLNSLIFQHDVKLQIIIVTQRFTNEDIEAVQKLAAPIFALKPDIMWEIRNFQRERPVDARGRLLSLGLAAAEGQFIYFLDYDDWIYPSALDAFISKFKEIPSAGVVFGNVDKYVVEVNDHFVVAKAKSGHQFRYRDVSYLVQGNFAPIHSYIYNRAVIDPALLYVDPHLRIEEDYELLLRVVGECGVGYLDPEFIVGVYAIKTDGSNTVADGLKSEDKKNYETTTELINARKRFIYPQI